ncbi:unnamed protein product [Ilex paraguariensis]|uniref:Uncharacterized protein n=1 Tax=Ilex paraguariensis TaxID=185542 RepID=A0ABC8U8C1_9AQUA
MHGGQPANNYGVWPTSIWALAAGNQFSSLSYGNQADQLLTASKGWQNGDWICTCGFHKCSPRAQNIDTNSLGGWEDGANGWSEILSKPSMSQKSDSLVPADWSRVLLDTNSLGGWEDGANGWSEILSEPSMSQKSDSLVPADWSRVLLSCGAKRVDTVSGDQGEERLWKNRDC